MFVVMFNVPEDRPPTIDIRARSRAESTRMATGKESPGVVRPHRSL
jgi:hypothetical protein